MKEVTMKKKLIIASAVAALGAASAVPAMAFENEFHGMYKFMGYQTNFFDGGTGAPALKKDARSGFVAEQRARINYIAKANDNLKLVTHFELDTRFGGIATPAPTATSPTTGYKGTNGNDAGNLDADQLTLETKNVYLDFSCPITGANAKVGIQPWSDAYGSLFLAADMTGAYVTKKFSPLTASLGWFRFDNNDVAGSNVINRATADLFVLDGKFAINKDVTIGASYYNVQNDIAPTTPNFELLHMIGLNADIKAGPASIKPFLAYQFGDKSATADLTAFLAGATAKIKAGPGSVNASAIYLSGDDNTTGDDKGFKNISAPTSYFGPANMWLIVRSGQGINSSNSVIGNDVTVGGRGLIGFFAGYEGTMDKLFYNANVGYAMTAQQRTNAGVEEESSIGTELNAQVGYKLYDNLSACAAVAYAILGDGLNSTTTAKRFGGVADADNPYMVNLQLSYSF
jgi:hypothetical protein